MAKKNNSTPSSEERTFNDMYDKRGELRLRLGSETREYEEDDRDITERTVDNVETSQGTMYGITDLMRQGPNRMVLATCDKCEEETRSFFFKPNSSKMTMSPAPDIRRCYRCRKSLCQRHLYPGLDHLPRCKNCHRWHWFYQKFIKPLVWLRF